MHRSRPPFGYVRRDDGRLEVDPVAAPLVTRAFEMRRQGTSLAKIADAINGGLPDSYPRRTASRIREMLQRRTYLGEGPGAFGIVKEGAHPALVKPAQFRAVQSRGKPVRTKGGNGALLKGLVRCASCGNAMRVTGPSSRQSYVCQPQSSRGRCEHPAGAKVSAVEDFVIRVIATMDDEGTDAQTRAYARIIEARTRVSEAEEVLNDLASPDSHRNLGRDRWRSATAAAREQFDTAQAELDDAEMAVEDPEAVAEGEAWRFADRTYFVENLNWSDPTADVEAKRRHIARFVQEVKVAQADPRRRRWQPVDERVVVRWRGGGFVDGKRLHRAATEAAQEARSG